ncbi:hypothetical protein PAPYR_1640 [Paratrimastix pyriformis]|uniref:RING-type domain-containing protein n=1 Tax=Paratrimastix pyriformis TaxID=342808 RepID=A0ABQ8UYV4_9EUKA|nr:hypothetical protein PAPYR_1640 [Paratrimastix pyriformis]
MQPRVRGFTVIDFSSAFAWEYKVEAEGGFPTEIFEQEVPDVMLCPICREVMRKPVTLICGGSHKACETCSQKWVQEKKGQNVPCPFCNEIIPAPHFHRDPIFNSFIQQLPVRCSQVTEPSVGGGRRPARGAVRSFRWRKSQSTHRATDCPAEKVRCPDCGRPFRRAGMEDHRARCPHAILHCPISGCKVQVARCRLADHIASSAALHVTCLSKILAKEHALAAELQRSLDALQTTAELLQLAPSELFDHLRQLGPRTLEQAEPNWQCVEFVFELRARVPVRVVGLGLYVQIGKTGLVHSRPGSLDDLMVGEGWTRLGSTRLSHGGLWPVCFPEPVLLAAGQSVTFSCDGVIQHRGPATHGNADIDMMPGINWVRASGVRGTGVLAFAGKIFYALQ